MDVNFSKLNGTDLYYLPASDMHPADTHFHFSFANYIDPQNMDYGVLRVLNDDDVRPESGFGRHSHSDMEIVSYVVNGTLTHWDNALDKEEQLGRGHVQIVTVGTGVVHSEMNNQKDNCRFLQIWIMPPAEGLPVRYNNNKFDLADRENTLLQIVGNPTNADKVPLYLNQDVNLYVSEITNAEAVVSYSVSPGRQAYVNCIEGELNVSDTVKLVEKDSLKVSSGTDLTFTSPSGGGHFIIIEMEESK